ncbi:MAG TPA: hypothetical protein VHI11_03130 [Jiangellaceae bacterium]|nr:hypothetical protein [Jiangellaceae bacterium]
MSVLLWEDLLVPSLLSAALVAVLALAAAVGRPLLGAGVAAVQVVFTLGGVRPAALPAAQAGAWLALVASVATSAWMVLGETTGIWPVAALLSLAFVAAILIQLLRRDGRQAMTTSLTITVAACALAMLPVAWLALLGGEGGVDAVWLGLLGVGVVGLTEPLPVPAAVRRSAAVLLAGAAAAGLVRVVGGVSASVPVAAVVVAVFAALAAVIAVAAINRVAGELEDSSTVAVLTPLRMTLPVVVAAPVSYVLGRILLG